MYKTLEEMRGMSVEEIVAYVVQLEETDHIAKNNGVAYVEWCGDQLDDALAEKGIEPEDFEALLSIYPAS